MSRTTHVIFENTTSALYYSNDGRLHVVRQGNPQVWTVVRLDDPKGAHLEDLVDAPVVFASNDRVKVDAYIAGYIAGYDLACEGASA